MIVVLSSLMTYFFDNDLCLIVRLTDHELNINVMFRLNETTIMCQLKQLQLLPAIYL